MRILIVTPSYWPALQFGGPVSYTRALAQALHHGGVETEVLTTDTGLGPGDAPVNTRVTVNDVPVTYCNTVKAADRLGATGWQWSPALTRLLLRDVHRFDLLHLHGIWNYPAAAAAFAARQVSRPYIITAHGALYPHTLRHKRWKKAPYYVVVAGQLLRRAAAVHYLTSDERSACHTFCGLTNEAMVVPPGVSIPPLEEPAERREDAGIVILFLGRLHWIKGVDRLLDAFQAVHRVEPRVRLVLAGPDEGARASLERQAAALGVAAYVTFRPMVRNDADKAALLRESDVFVLPSRSEGFSVALLEAAAAGLPLVITEACRFPAVATEGAGHVTDGTPTGLAEALTYYVRDARARADAGGRARGLAAREYAWPLVAARMAEAYARVAGRDAA
jgi:glycosyltransferase involved in cell wall biosynthesis